MKIENEETGRSDGGSDESSEAESKEERVPEPGPLKRGSFVDRDEMMAFV